MTDITERLREWVKSVRRKPTPLSEAIPMVSDASDEIDNLKAENEALRKDAERLDFIEQEMNRTVHCLTGKWYWSRKPFKTYMREGGIREAIDAARGVK